MAYRQLGNAGMVQALEDLENVEEKQLLAGHVAVILGETEKARDLFLSSLSPEAALDLHCDLLQWDRALELAPQLAPHRMPEIYLKSAVQVNILFIFITSATK